MITARDAAAISEKHRQYLSIEILSLCEKAIQSVASQGVRAVRFPGEKIPHHHKREFMDTLRNLGYKVEHCTGDQREPDNTYYLICW